MLKPKILKIPAALQKALVLSFCLLVQSTFAFELAEFEASYVAKITKGISLTGTAIRSLKQTSNNNWRYEFSVKSFAADIDESSNLFINTQATEDGPHYSVKPVDYRYKLSAFLMSDRKRTMRFDWQQGTAFSQYKKDKWNFTDIPENTHDPLSYQLQLQLDIATGKQKMDYQVVKKGKLDESTFVLIDNEIIDTKFGKLKAIVTKKLRAEDAKRETLMWFSSEHPMILLKMTQRESDGDEYEINLNQASIKGKPVVFSRE